MLQKLGFMIALAREKHFGQAAESCGVAQPTLSQGIQQLEEMLNVQLVKRSSRFLGFTPEGERVLIWARRLVGDADAMRHEILGLQNGISSHLRIAAVPSAMPAVASITAPFQLNHPTARFTVLTRSSDELADLLHKREIDAGVTYIDNELIEDVETVPLYREQYLLLTTPDGPSGGQEHVAWHQIATFPLCLFTRDLQHRRIVDGIFRAVGVEVMPVVETDSIVGLTSHVCTGNLASVVPNSILESIELNGMLRALPIMEPEVNHTIGLVVSKRFPIQPVVKTLINEARRLSTAPLLATG